MNDSVRESAIALMISRLAGDITTLLPTGIPVATRNIWTDVEGMPSEMPALGILGFEDGWYGSETDVPQRSMLKSPVVPRTLRVNFGLWAVAESSVTASQWIDRMAQWIQARLCGVTEHGGPFAKIAEQIQIGRMTEVPGQGGVVRGLVEVILDYRTLVNDATRWQ
jgi:hypothetical protein